MLTPSCNASSYLTASLDPSPGDMCATSALPTSQCMGCPKATHVTFSQRVVVVLVHRRARAVPLKRISNVRIGRGGGEKVCGGFFEPPYPRD